MAYKKAKGKELFDFAAANPGANIAIQNNPAKVDIKKYQRSAEDKKIQGERDSRGFIGNFVYDVLKGATAAPRTLLSNRDGNLLDTEEKRRFRDNPNVASLQSIGNTASYFIPAFGVGGNAAKFATGAAASAGLQSASTQDLSGGKSLDAGEILKSAGTGAALGYGLSKVGSAVNKRLSKTPVFDEAKGAVQSGFSKKAQNLDYRLAGMQEVPASAGGNLNYTKGFNDSASRIEEALVKNGLPRNTKGFAQLAEIAQKDLAELVPKMQVSVGAPNLVDDVVSRVMRTNATANPVAVKQAVTQLLGNTAESRGLLKGASLDAFINGKFPLGAEDLYSIKQTYQGIRPSPGDVDSAISSALHDSAANILKQDPTFGAEYDDLTRNFVDFFQQNPNFVNRTPLMTAEGTLTPASVVGGVITGGTRKVVQGAEKVASGLGNLPRLSKVLGRLQPQNGIQGAGLGAVATTPARQPIGLDGSYADTIDQSFEQPATTEGGTEGSDFKSFYGIGGDQATTAQTSELEFYQFYRQQGIPDTQARYMAGVAYEDQLRSNPVKRKRKLTAQDRVAKTRAEFGLEGTFQMRKFLENDIDFNSLTAQGILPQFMKSNEAQKFKVVTDKIADAITRAMTGAALTKTEMDFYNGQVPVFGDTPENIQYKLSSLEEFFQSMYPDEYEDIYK